MLTMPGRNTSFGRLARTLTVGLVILAMAFLGACGDDQDTQATQEPQPTAAEESAAPSGPPSQVVATTNFVADWARVVGGDRVEVFGMLPAGGDPHSYQPGARDVARVADADVVFTVGLELETLWLEDLIRSASADESRIVALGEVVDPMEFTEADMHDDHDDHGDHSDHEEDHSDHEEDHSD
ncbi:MAG: zinc ABC transporter substrate-binding protein, partial [Acidimicrobiia bacterium]|nr:zinc ABC transporter substrate-binding protein [Acidimicrobiia bacterium]